MPQRNEYGYLQVLGYDHAIAEERLKPPALIAGGFVSIGTNCSRVLKISPHHPLHQGIHTPYPC